MHRAVIACLLLVSGWAHALTLSPMYKDELIYTDFYMANFELENTSKNVMYYDIWVTHDVDTLMPEDEAYWGDDVLGGNSYKKIEVPIVNIKPNEMETVYICVQEKEKKGKLAVVGRACAKLRLYWPLQELQTLQ